jgi:hypothetical protein
MELDRARHGSPRAIYLINMPSPAVTAGGEVHGFSEFIQIFPVATRLLLVFPFSIYACLVIFQ